MWSKNTWVKLLGGLTPLQQWVLYLHLLQGRSQPEVCESLNRSRGSVEAAWRRALCRIRAALVSPAGPQPPSSQTTRAARSASVISERKKGR